MIELQLPFVQSYEPPRRHGRRYFNPLQKIIDKCKWLIRSQYSDPPLKGMITGLLIFEIALPKSMSKKKKLSKLGQPCLKKIDVDNLSKLTCDVLKGIVFDDDSQVWHLTLIKIWKEQEATRIYLWEDTDSKPLEKPNYYSNISLIPNLIFPSTSQNLTSSSLTTAK